MIGVKLGQNIFFNYLPYSNKIVIFATNYNNLVFVGQVPKTMNG